MDFFNIPTVSSLNIFFWAFAFCFIHGKKAKDTTKKGKRRYAPNVQDLWRSDLEYEPFFITRGVPEIHGIG